MARPTQCQVWEGDDPTEVCGKYVVALVTTECQICSIQDSQGMCLDCLANCVNGEHCCTACFTKTGEDHHTQVVKATVLA